MSNEELEMVAAQKELAAECRQTLRHVTATSGILLDVDLEFEPDGPDHITLGIHLTADPNSLNPIGNFWLVPELLTALKRLGGLTSLSELIYALEEFSSERKREYWETAV